MSACISYQLMAYLWPFRIRRVLQNSFRRELHCWGLRYWVISSVGWDAVYSEVLCSVISVVNDFCLNPSFLPASSRESNWWYEFPQEETETVTLSQGSQGSGSGRKKEFSIQQICQGLLSEDFRGFRDNGMRKNLSIASRFWGLPSESLREGGGRIGVDIHTKVEVPPLNIQLQADPLPCLTLWRMFRGMHPFLFIFMKIKITFWLQEILSRVFGTIFMKTSRLQLCQMINGIYHICMF